MKNEEFNLDAYKEEKISYIASITVFSFNEYDYIPDSIQNIIKSIHLLSAAAIAVITEQTTKKDINQAHRCFITKLKQYFKKLKKEYCKHYHVKGDALSKLNYNCSLKEFYQELETQRKENTQDTIFEEKLSNLDFSVFKDPKEIEIINYWKLLARSIAKLTNYNNLDNIIKNIYFHTLKSIQSYRLVNCKIKELELAITNISDHVISLKLARLKAEVSSTIDFDNMTPKVEQIEALLKKYYQKRAREEAISHNESVMESICNELFASCLNELKTLSSIHDTEKISLILTLQQQLILIFKKFKEGEFSLETLTFLKSLDLTNLTEKETIMSYITASKTLTEAPTPSNR